MASTVSYQPIFRGQFPGEARARWELIRLFINRWCRPENAEMMQAAAAKGELLDQAQQRCQGRLSPAIANWLALFEQLDEHGFPVIRDCLVFDRLDEHLDPAPDADYSTLMVSGEGDLIWAVADDCLTDDDPPVEVFQCFDEDSDPLHGITPSVSEFALKYLFLYNEHARVATDWFSADLTDAELAQCRAWFEHELTFSAEDQWSGGHSFLERDNAAALLRQNRLEVSLFDRSLNATMPAPMQAALARHQELRRQFER